MVLQECVDRYSLSNGTKISKSIKCELRFSSLSRQHWPLDGPFLVGTHPLVVGFGLLEVAARVADLIEQLPHQPAPVQQVTADEHMLPAQTGRSHPAPLV